MRFLDAELKQPTNRGLLRGAIYSGLAASVLAYLTGASPYLIFFGAFIGSSLNEFGLSASTTPKAWVTAVGVAMLLMLTLSLI
jgi:hypothetical protein